MDEKVVKRRRVFAEDFKRDALDLLQKSGRPQKIIESDLGISKGALGRWKREAENTGVSAFRGHGNATPIQAELSRLQRENQILKGERDLLKKAIALVAKERG
jgi:transposase